MLEFSFLTHSGACKLKKGAHQESRRFPDSDATYFSLR